MDVLDLQEYYRTLTEDELLQLAHDSKELSLEAQSALRNELSRRGADQNRFDSLGAEAGCEADASKTEAAARIYGLFPSLRGIVETLIDWREFHRQTGEWPVFTMAFSFLHVAADLLFLGLFVWYSFQHGWSKWAFVLVIAPVVLVDVMVASWLTRKIRLYELARYRRERQS